jgi:hypothetical protein
VSGFVRTFRTWLYVAVAGFLVVVVLLIGARRPADPTFLVTTGLAGSVTSAAGIVFTEGHIAVGGVCRLVIVADNEAERTQGLQARPSLDPYDGMLFVFEATTRVAFTMANTLIPLSIGFYDANGHRTGALDMTPCPRPPEHCPRYLNHRRFRYALETGRGQLPTGNLGSC